MKKDGGLVRNWQIHHLTIPPDMIRDYKWLTDMYPDILYDPGPLVFTGTIVHDAAQRWQPGDHMRSSYIVAIDRDKGVIETQNTIYKVINEGGDIYPDLGNGILKIFY